MKNDKPHIERQLLMRSLLDEFQSLVDQMVVHTNWNWAADEDELTALVMVVQVLANDFKNSITLIKEKKYGTRE